MRRALNIYIMHFHTMCINDQNQNTKKEMNTPSQKANSCGALQSQWKVIIPDRVSPPFQFLFSFKRILRPLTFDCATCMASAASCIFSILFSLFVLFDFNTTEHPLYAGKDLGLMCVNFHDDIHFTIFTHIIWPPAHWYKMVICWIKNPETVIHSAL